MTYKLHWGPWMRFTGETKPPHLKDNERIQCIYINANGDLKSDADNGSDRPADNHIWHSDDMPKSMTLAYRTLIAHQEQTND